MDNKLVVYRAKSMELPDDDFEKADLHEQIVKIVADHKKDYPDVPIYMNMQFGYEGSMYASTCKVLALIETDYTSPTLIMDNNPLWDIHGTRFNVTDADVEKITSLDKEFVEECSTDHIDYNRLYDLVEEIYLAPTSPLYLPNKQAKIILSTLEEA